MAVIVPITQAGQSTNGRSSRPAMRPPDEPFALMAAAQMHDEGRLFRPQDKMPFPDNRNPDTDFAARFPGGGDTKSGILNDLKPSGPVPPLARKL